MKNVKLLKDGSLKIKFVGKSRGLLLDLVLWGQQGEEDPVRRELLKEIEAKLQESATVKLRMSEITLITELLKELPESYAIILTSYLNPEYLPIEVHK